MKTEWNNKKSKELFQAVLKLRTLDEAKKFFRDLLTEEEIIEFSKRWQAAQMLNDSVPYSQIEKSTGLSSTTVARVSKWLNSGTGGYKLIIKRTHHRRDKSLSGKALR